MKTIGIKLADGSFYPIMEEGQPVKKTLGLTTVNDNQTRVLVDVYRSKTSSMDDAEYVDTLQIDNLVAHPNGALDINLNIGLDENNKLHAEMLDPETGATSNANVTLVSRTEEERLEPTNYDVKLDGTVAEEKTDDSEGEGSAAAGAVAGAAVGGLAAAAALALAREKEKEENKQKEEAVQEEPALDDEMPSFEENPLEEPVAEDTSDVTADSLSTDEFDLPDFGEESASGEEEIPVPVATDETVPAASESPDFSDFELPDFGEETPALDESASEKTADEPAAEEASSSDETLAASGDDDIFGSSDLVKDNTPSNGINFDGLYDKETEAGASSYSEDLDNEDTGKKTRVPVIICIICAIICIIATLLILFIVPSKYNLLNKSEKNEKVAVEQIVEENTEPEEAEEEPVAEPEPPVVEAKEDEVVVAEEPAQVIPEAPKEPEKKPENITYKIKWGDTLWDIADAYYKNPWAYKKIARYNGIKNPDHIISGTYITIPAK